MPPTPLPVDAPVHPHSHASRTHHAPGAMVASRDDVAVHLLGGEEGVAEALGLLDVAEALAPFPLVDEATRARLEGISIGGPLATHWHAIAADRRSETVGFAGVTLPDDAGRDAVADLALDRQSLPLDPVLASLLAGLESLAWEHDAGSLEVWIRAANTGDVVVATEAGFRLDRRLAVLGRRCLDGRCAEDEAMPAGYDLARFRRGVDEDAVVDLLAAAYAGTGDGGWTRADFEKRYAYDWFRDEDVLLAWRGGMPAPGASGDLGGIHWTKRRGDGVGEVYNLAVSPDHVRKGLGRALLRAGLAHLGDVGAEDVALWVDLTNDRGVRLYASEGFQFRQEDIALTRTLRGRLTAP